MKNRKNCSSILFPLFIKYMISLFFHKGYGYFIKMNEKKKQWVPVLVYEETDTYYYFFSDLDLKANLFVLNVRALMYVLMTQEIIRSKWCEMQNRWITLKQRAISWRCYSNRCRLKTRL